MIQTRPVCFGCEEFIDGEPIFAAACDHEDHVSLCWHGVCLMRWREHRTELMQKVGDSFAVVFERWRRR